MPGQAPIPILRKNKVFPTRLHQMIVLIARGLGCPWSTKNKKMSTKPVKMQNRNIGLRSVALWQDSENIVPWLRSFTPTNSVCVMKTKWITLALMSFATCLSAAAQDYWVIETHPNELRTQVRFYDDQNTILHSEQDFLEPRLGMDKPDQECHYQQGEQRISQQCLP